MHRRMGFSGKPLERSCGCGTGRNQILPFLLYYSVPKYRYRSLKFLHAHIQMLDDPAVEHRSRYTPSSTFILQPVETIQDDPLFAGESVSHIRKIVNNIRGHRSFSP